MAIPFNRDYPFDYAIAQTPLPWLRRVVARNPSPFTFQGTGTFIVGTGKVAIIDPGPDIAEHIDAVLEAVSGETVTHLLVTHTHRDHSPASAALKARWTPWREVNRCWVCARCRAVNSEGEQKCCHRCHEAAQLAA